ncbi:NAD(+) synthase [Patescibacteria group bacterium]
MHINRADIPDHLLLTPEECEARLNAKADELRWYIDGTPFENFVIGESGGIDSALATAIAVRAVGPKRVIAVRLPFEQLHTDSMGRAAEVARTFGLPEQNLLTVDITAAVNASWSSVSHISLPSRGYDAAKGDRKLRRGNMAARERMKILFDLAKVFNALVLGTENLSENWLAYYTVGGDEISSVETIKNLWKCQVFQMAEAAGVPQSILDTPPSAELWEGQTDEDEVGKYLAVDTVLSLQEFPGLAVSQYGVSPEDEEKIMLHVRMMEGKRNAPYILQG